jgi:hypothetical protein
MTDSNKVELSYKEGNNTYVYIFNRKPDLAERAKEIRERALQFHAIH